MFNAQLGVPPAMELLFEGVLRAVEDQIGYQRMLFLVYLNDLFFDPIAEQLEDLASVELPLHGQTHLLVDQRGLLSRVDPPGFEHPPIGQVHFKDCLMVPYMLLGRGHISDSYHLIIEIGVIS